MDVSGVNYQDRDRGLPPRLIWLAGAIAVCRGVLATLYPAIRSVFPNL